METKHEMSGEESLQIITKMIKQAKGNISAASFYFLLWGWIGIIASLSHFILDVYTDFRAPYAVWLITIPGWIISFIHGWRNSGKRRVTTYSDGITMWTWIAYSFCIIIIIFAGRLVNYNISALIILFSAFATFLTGIIINFRPLMIGGAIFWILSPVAFYVGPVYSQLVIAAAIALGYLVPAYMLKRQN